MRLLGHFLHLSPSLLLGRLSRGLVTLVLLLVLGLAQAGEYYVSPTGTAAWSECSNMSTPCSAATSPRRSAGRPTPKPGT